MNHEPNPDNLLLSSLMKSMDIPVFRRDVDRDQHVVWLIAHLRTRNQGHHSYVEVMRRLLAIARAHNLLKRNECESHEAHLQTVVQYRVVSEPQVWDVSMVSHGGEPMNTSPSGQQAA